MNNMYKVHSEETIKKAEFIFRNGLTCEHRLSKKDIEMANSILVQSRDKEFKAKIAQMELELKKMRLQRKEVKNQIRTRYKKIMGRFGYLETKINDKLKDACWNRYIGFYNQNGECVCCKRNVNKNSYEVRCVVPICKGGSLFIDNLRIICGQCIIEIGKDEVMGDFVIRKGYNNKL